MDCHAAGHIRAEAIHEPEIRWADALLIAEDHSGVASSADRTRTCVNAACNINAEAVDELPSITDTLVFEIEVKASLALCAPHCEGGGLIEA